MKRIVFMIPSHIIFNNATVVEHVCFWTERQLHISDARSRTQRMRVEAPQQTALDPQSNSLRIRVLDGNALKKLSAEPNSSKYAIDAHNRSIEQIRDLSELPKLCSLDVSFNRLTSLKNLNTAKELREVKAYNNNLTSLRGVRGNGKLEGLLVHENAIEEIPDDLTVLPKLKTLWMNGNRIARVQHLTACRLLVHLDLSRNRLTGAAADGLESLSSLELLNLSNNQITSIGNLSHLTKLEELNLANNTLSTVEGALLPPSLSVLRLNGNQLTSLAELPMSIPKLSELYVQENSIIDLGSKLAARCPHIESLDLRNNRVRSIAQLVAALEGCDATLMDLWIQGNPCCLSSTYLLDMFTALPELKTLDNMSDTQLMTHMTALRSGQVTQETLLATVSRPMTPSTRPGTGSSRPGSSSYRPLTPSSSSDGSRPVTPDRGPPVFHQPSARAGALLKVATPQELERAHAEVAERLEKMKTMIRRIGTGGSIAKEPNRSTTRSDRAMAPSLSRREPPISGRHPDQLERRDASATKKVSVDAGTDPLDSLMGGVRVSHAITPEVMTPRRGTETQTPREPVVVMPPAPMQVQTATAMSASAPRSKTTETSTRPLNDNQLEGHSSDAEQIDGEQLEKQMKQLLLQFAQAEDVLDKLTGEPHDGDEDDESPRIVESKTAQQRLPPNPRSRQGYRSFRIPARLRGAASEKVTSGGSVKAG